MRSQDSFALIETPGGKPGVLHKLPGHAGVFQFYGEIHLSLWKRIGLGVQFWHPSDPGDGALQALYPEAVLP
jgi:hypothetical protein